MISKESLSLIALDLGFVALAVAASNGASLPELSPELYFIALGLAAFRLGRSVSFNLIGQPLRELVGVKEEPDSSGAGNNNHAKGAGLRRVLGELVCCPICSGTWAALALVLVNSLNPRLGLVLVLALGAAGLAEFVNWLSEAGQWVGRGAREVSGLLNGRGKDK